MALAQGPVIFCPIKPLSVWMLLFAKVDFGQRIANMAS
jgi:hypothetical protein